MSPDDPTPPVWPLVAIVLGVSGFGLAFAPYPAGFVAGAAGLVGVIAGTVAVIRVRWSRGRSPALAVGGIALSVAAIAVASVSTARALDRQPPADKTDHVMARELDVRIGDFEASPPGKHGRPSSGPRLLVTLTNKRDVPATYSIAVGGYLGDSDEQIRADRIPVTLAGGASQEVEMFTKADKSTAQRLQGADFRLIGAWSHVPELGA
ncbi:hypothetical protein [Mycolicibacterium sp. HK-90]|uniref:hypothetical protein n=1 Tax=Mycolicibacterium sp. HK-90 TaxID=3056937 RepID=UPI00265942BF|nr:hypothetical protein [Mycolicibacterium sp. HK-90]WKG05565.1 hypothetical protein QU592_11005 [Mycolicibacterium sp. HK-90]